MARIIEEKIENFADLFSCLNYTIRAFSDEFGIPYRTVQEWRNGNSRIPKYALHLFIEHFNNIADAEEKKANGRDLSRFNNLFDGFGNLEDTEKESVLKIVNAYIKSDDNVRDLILSRVQETAINRE